MYVCLINTGFWPIYGFGLEEGGGGTQASPSQLPTHCLVYQPYLCVQDKESRAVWSALTERLWQVDE